MTDKKQKQPEPVHYCNTCKHSQMPVTQAPCHECVPRKFGGPDRWEKITKEEIEDIQAAEEISWRRDQGL